MQNLATIIILAGCLSAAPAYAQQQTVKIGTGLAVLLRPPDSIGSIVMVPGGDMIIAPDERGNITKLKQNQLVRTRRDYFKRGYAVLIVDRPTDVAAAIRYMADVKTPVALVATSRGSIRAVEAIANGAQPDVLVLTAAFLSLQSGDDPKNAIAILKSPRLLPKTLVIHHRNDACHYTSPKGVEPFLRWTNGRAKVVWLDGGVNVGDPCKARAYHGFNGLDDQVVEQVVAFIEN